MAVIERDIKNQNLDSLIFDGELTENKNPAMGFARSDSKNKIEDKLREDYSSESEVMKFVLHFVL